MTDFDKQQLLRNQPATVWRSLSGPALRKTVYVLDRTLDMSGHIRRALARWNERMMRLRFEVAYEPRTDDIFIATYPRSGTTWLQMILYQLLTDGSMDIPHLNRFSPYLEDLIRGDPAILNSGERIRWSGSRCRIAKTHLPYKDVPKGCGRYIYVVRDGRDVAVSFYHHSRRQGYRGTFAQFFDDFMTGTVGFGSWFDHATKWSLNGDNLNLLFLRYEDLQADLEGSVRQIAGFCGIPLDERELPRVLTSCSFDFMRAHETKLDVKTRRVDIEPQNDHFVRKGQRGDWQSLLDEGMCARYSAKLNTYSAAAPVLKAYSESLARLADSSSRIPNESINARVEKDGEVEMPTTELRII